MEEKTSFEKMLEDNNVAYNPTDDMDIINTPYYTLTADCFKTTYSVNADPVSVAALFKTVVAAIVEYASQVAHGNKDKPGHDKTVFSVTDLMGNNMIAFILEKKNGKTEEDPGHWSIGTTQDMDVAKKNNAFMLDANDSNFEYILGKVGIDSYNVEIHRLPDLTPILILYFLFSNMESLMRNCLHKFSDKNEDITKQRIIRVKVDDNPRPGDPDIDAFVITYSGENDTLRYSIDVGSAIKMRIKDDAVLADAKDNK